MSSLYPNLENGMPGWMYIVYSWLLGGRSVKHIRIRPGDKRGPMPILTPGFFADEETVSVQEFLDSLQK